MKCLPFTLALSLLCIDLGAQSNFTALKVSDKTEYVSTSFNPNFGEDQDFSIEFKVRTNGWTSDPSLVSDKNWSSGGNKGFNIALRSDRSGIDVNVGDGVGARRVDLEGGSIADNNWHHVLVTFDRDALLTLYIDGVSIGNKNMSNVGDIDTPHLLKIGQDGTGSYGSGTTAEISDVRIWNRVIATNEVSYCRSDLLANWKLDEGTGTIAQDAAGSNDGTLQGGASWTSGHNHNGFVIPLGCPTDVVEEDVVEIRYVPFASKYLLMALIAVLISVFLLRRG